MGKKPQRGRAFQAVAISVSIYHMARIQDNYYRRKRQAEEESGQRRFNIEEAMKDKLNPEIQGSYNPYSTALTNRLNSGTFGPGYEEIDAPTTNELRPRALKAGYNPTTETLVIIFRPNQRVNPLTGGNSDTGPAPWIKYEGVSLDLWEGLKNSPSTGEYLRTSGIDNMSWVKIPGSGSLPRTRPQSFQSGTEE